MLQWSTSLYLTHDGDSFSDVIYYYVVCMQRVSRMSPVAMTTGSRCTAAALDRAASTDSVLVRTHITQVYSMRCPFTDAESHHLNVNVVLSNTIFLIFDHLALLASSEQ